jgi:Holliday junction resolvase RusA-like endonuclease
MTSYTLHIPHWQPATVNQLMHSVRGRIRRKKADREMVCAYTLQARIPRAERKRRVSLHIILGKGQRGADADAYHKSLLDACKHAGLILDDSSRYVELAPVTFSRDWKNWGTTITLDDL